MHWQSFGQRGYEKIDMAYGGSIVNDNTITGRVALRFQSVQDWVDNLAPGHEIRNVTGGYKERGSSCPNFMATQ